MLKRCEVCGSENAYLFLLLGITHADLCLPCLRKFNVSVAKDIMGPSWVATAQENIALLYGSNRETKIDYSLLTKLEFIEEWLREQRNQREVLKA